VTSKDARGIAWEGVMEVDEGHGCAGEKGNKVGVNADECGIDQRVAEEPEGVVANFLEEALVGIEDMGRSA
jgi:hypothetical protein